MARRLTSAAPASTPARCDTKIVASSAGTKPFAVSVKTTGNPSRQPNVRQTFVPPMFPLPCARMSVRFTARTSQYPVGIEPAT